MKSSLDLHLIRSHECFHLLISLFLTNLEDEILVKGVGFVKPKNLYKAKKYMDLHKSVLGIVCFPFSLYILT